MFYSLLSTLLLQFQPDSPITDAISGYKANPSLNEQAHCVLFTLDAFKLTSYPSSLKSTLRKLNTTLSDLGKIPYPVLFALLAIPDSTGM